jgi:hypothetical protein
MSNLVDHANLKGARLFVEAGKGLYGDGRTNGDPDWALGFHRDLGLNLRSARRMGDGSVPIPRGVWDDVQKLLREEAERLLKLAAGAPPEGDDSTL